MTYPVQFRKKVLATKEKEGLSFEETSVKYGLSKTTILKWIKNIEPQKTRNKPWKKLSKEGLINDIKQFPDSYSYERAKRLGVSQSGITYALKRLKISYKKNSHSPKGGSRKKIYILPTDKRIEGSR